MSDSRWQPRVGDWVEIRPLDEIMATLDAGGNLDAMPFMPEMVRFAGRRFQVSASAHKTCDTVNRSGGRRVPATVHLANLRCDGASHGGCQAACLLFWKTAWLRPADGPGATPAAVAEAPVPERLEANTSSRRGEATVYRCQATTLPSWSQPLPWWDLRQYWLDVRTGNAPLGHVLKTLFLATVFNLRRMSGGYRLSLWLYPRLHQMLHGIPDPHGVGSVPRGQPTPDERTNLQIGEVVRIRSKEEIFATVNPVNRNRGLQIDEEMTRYCGQSHRVVNRVTRIINEGTGEMMNFGNPCIVLEGVDCLGHYSENRLMCPRRITAYWREIWLTRDGASAPQSDRPA